MKYLMILTICVMFSACSKKETYSRSTTTSSTTYTTQYTQTLLNCEKRENKHRVHYKCRK